MYGDSQALSAHAASIYTSIPDDKEALFAKSRDLHMDSDTCFSDYKQYNSNQNNPGLLRFRSAPSSSFANFTDGGADESGINSGDNEGLPSSRFSSAGVQSRHVSPGVQVLEESKAMVNGYALNSQLLPQYPRPSAATLLASANGGGYGVQNSMGMDHQGQAKIGSNLTRQNSSPAGLFSHLTSQNGYATMRDSGGFGFSNGTSAKLSPSSNRLKGQMDFPSGMPSISEVENETERTNGSDDGRDTQFYGSGFPFGSWNDSSKFTEYFGGLKREIDSDQNLFSDAQGGEPRIRPPILSHHLSLPKTSAEIAAMDKLLQLQDTVPCKIRAKRGCATHPRSIAERVRRTRISERMRKLQDLVPNMDKQTNTADMLDLAVDYVKDLQKQYKTLTDIRANCKCSSTQKPVPDQMY